MIEAKKNAFRDWCGTIDPISVDTMGTRYPGSETLTIGHFCGSRGRFCMFNRWNNSQREICRRKEFVSLYVSPGIDNLAPPKYVPEILFSISGSTFKGFFIQARDPETDKWIGSWAQTENTSTHPECSAVTHADPHVKEHATLVWNAPPNAHGRVYFTGTILKEYGTYWSNVVATPKQ
ncbi:uncharacterized protein LOC116431237 isoform X1 [Nomia melanderi]|uniref:uncharacterized protein LOC116431237 isoform X1 n=1 Tax=Nomia melanderi TaxID=2448451 RepID=UPI003FCC2AFE